MIQNIGQGERKFELISLEPDYGQLYQNYIYQKCHKCHKSADKQDFALCLLCGYFCCVRKCDSGTHVIGSKFCTIYFYCPYLKLEVPGNLCQHSVLHHSGNSVFLNVMRGSHILYFNKRLFEFNGLYANSFGMIV